MGRSGTMTAARRKEIRQQARADGKCGECSSRPALEDKSRCLECKTAGDARDRAARALATPAPEIEGRLAKPLAGELCHCGAQVAALGVEFCVKHGREYGADMKGRFKP